MANGHAPEGTSDLARGALADIQLVAQLRSAFQEAQVVMAGTLAKAGLTEQRYHLLLAVAATGPEGTVQSAIARELRCPESRISLLVRELNDAGLLDTIRDGSDRRHVRVRLNERGEAVLGDAIAVQRAALHSLIATLDVAEVTRLAELVARTYLGLDLSVAMKTPGQRQSPARASAPAPEYATARASSSRRSTRTVSSSSAASS